MIFVENSVYLNKHSNDEKLQVYNLILVKDKNWSIDNFKYNTMLIKVFCIDLISFMPVLHMCQQVSFLFCFVRAHVAFELRFFTALPALMVQQ